MSDWRWCGAVAFGGWSVSLATHLISDPHTPPAHTPRTSTLSVVLGTFPCVSFPVCRVSYLLSVLICFVSDLLLSSVCPVLCVSVSVSSSVFVCLHVCLCLSVPVFSCEEFDKCASFRVLNVHAQRK